jgi:phosphoglucomutase
MYESIRNVKSAGEGNKADVYDYIDPVDKNVSKNQGIRFVWADGSRVVFRYYFSSTLGFPVLGQ